MPDSQSRKTINNTSPKHIITLAGVAFLLHLIWENAQMPLYEGFTSFAHNFPRCFIATIGDVFITLLVLGFLSLVKPHNAFTLSKKDYAALTLLGFFTALIVEQHALLLGKWGYNEFMPLIVYFQVGLTPILQMTILLPLSFFITQQIIRISAVPSSPSHNGREASSEESLHHSSSRKKI